MFYFRYIHNKYTLGFAGRGGGNAFYINTENNTITHGPGTDRGGKDPESDTVFGRIAALTGGERIVDSMRKQPGGSKPNGFISDKQFFIEIAGLHVLQETDIINKSGETVEVYRRRLKSSRLFTSQLPFGALKMTTNQKIPNSCRIQFLQ